MTRRALELAALGTGLVSPGPLVGCVIVDADGKIAGEGTYFFDDVTHAEVAALELAGDKAKGGTAYISLEPHSHHGRTPPCTEALIEAGIKRVVVPIEDPNPLVSGIGFATLREQGIEIREGILKREAEIQNEKFIHWHRTGRPFVHLKFAGSLDGSCATRTGESKWITGEPARGRGQLLRHQYDAILVGVNTVLADNPGLTDRSGLKRRRDLKRIVLDNRLRIDPLCSIVQSASSIPVIVFCDRDADPGKAAKLSEMGVSVRKQKGGGKNLASVLDALAADDVQGVLVEGGPSVSGSFLDNRLVDKVTAFVSPLIIGGTGALPAVGGEGPASLAEALRLKDVRFERCGGDFEITGYPESRAPDGD